MTSIIDQITATIAEVGKTARVTGLDVTHEAFDAAQAEQNAGETPPMIELRNGAYFFGPVPITRVASVPKDAENRNFALRYTPYSEIENDVD